MTQALDVSERVSEAGSSQVKGTPTRTTTTAALTSNKFATFAITFGIAFAILYTVFERLNWPFFTYHPAVGKIDFWMQRPRSGEGPPMYWYGWLALSFPVAALVGWIATLVSTRTLFRATIFCCVLAALWPAVFAIWSYIDGRTTFDQDVVQWIMWMSAIPGLAGAVAATYLIPVEWTERMWTRLLLIVPIGGLIVLIVSLKSFFLR
jgi:hypothetical protein